MKITFLIRSLRYGGAQRRVVVLAKQLKGRSHEVRVISFYAGGEMEAALREEGVVLDVIGKRGRWDIVRFLYRLATALRREPAEVVHGFLPDANVLASLLGPLVGRPRVVWGVTVSDLNPAWYGWRSRLACYLERNLSVLPARIIVDSQSGRRCAIAQGMPSERLVVICNGVDLDEFRPDSEARRRLRRAWRIADDEVLIGLVGRLDPVKDHPTFLRAAAKFAQHHSRTRFVCVGDERRTGYRAELEQLGQELGLNGRLIWAGPRRDMADIYNALDIATNCSVSEGLPYAVCEAMACGVPCVVTNVGDSALVVGDTGVVVPPRDPGALAAGWQECLIRGRDELGMMARRRVAEQFSLHQMVESTEAELLALR